MSTSRTQTPQPQNERIEEVDPAVAALLAQAKEDCRRDEEERREEEEAVKRHAEEWAQRQAARDAQIWRAREEAEARCREAEEKKRVEEQKRREEEERKKKEEEEEKRREAEAKEEEAMKKRKRDKGKGKAKEVEVVSLDDEDDDGADDDDADDDDNNNNKRANRAYVDVPPGSRPAKKRGLGGKVKLGGNVPCQWCVENGRVCKVHTSSTITKCTACTAQKLRCKAADGSAPKGLGLTLCIRPSKAAREQESKGLQEVLDQLATLQAELAIEREARRQERGRLLDVVEHIVIGTFGTQDTLRRLEDHLELAGKIGPWEVYVEEMGRQDEEHKKRTEEEQREKAREEEEQDRGEGLSAPPS